MAEQVLRGGVPAVRQAVEDQNATARAAGGPEVKAGPLVALAEQLLPRLRSAEWHDRADAAVAAGPDVALRDLRALVAGSDAARDEEARALAARLRQTLEERSAAERQAWLTEITDALDGGRVVRALRTSCRPPEPGARFPGELAERLSAAAAEAMGPDVAPDRWAAVLEALTTSPVRRSVEPRGLPAEPPAELLHMVRQAADRVPGLARLPGVSLGPPPTIGARRPGPPPRPPRPARPGPPPPASSASTISTPVGVAPSSAPAPGTDPAPEGTAAPARPAAGTAEVARAPERAGDPEKETAPAGTAVHPEPPGDAEPPANGVSADDRRPSGGEGGEAHGQSQSGDDGDDAVLVEELG